MSGETNLKYDVAHWDSILDSYEKQLGLPEFKYSKDGEELPNETDVQLYLSMSRDALEKMGSEDAGIAAAILSGYAFYLGRAFNREIARVNWAKSTMKSLVANDLNNHKAYSFEEKLLLSVKNNDVAGKLNNIAVYAQQRADRLNYMSASVKNLADALTSIQRSKQWKSQT